MLLQKLDRTGAFTLKKADTCLQKHLATWISLTKLFQPGKTLHKTEIIISKIKHLTSTQAE